MAKILLFELETSFPFGKHKGKKVSDVLKADLSYLEWCILNIATFLPSEELEAQIIKTINDPTLSKIILDILMEKREVYKHQLNKQWEKQYGEEDEETRQEEDYHRGLDKLNKDFWDQMKEEGWDWDID